MCFTAEPLNIRVKRTRARDHCPRVREHAGAVN
jgi:hypothetical protein